MTITTDKVRKAFEKVAEAQTKADALGAAPTVEAAAAAARECRQALEHAKSYVLELTDPATARQIARPGG